MFVDGWSQGIGRLGSSYLFFILMMLPEKTMGFTVGINGHLGFGVYNKAIIIPFIGTHLSSLSNDIPYSNCLPTPSPTTTLPLTKQKAKHTKHPTNLSLL